MYPGYIRRLIPGAIILTWFLLGFSLPQALYADHHGGGGGGGGHGGGGGWYGGGGHGGGGGWYGGGGHGGYGGGWHHDSDVAFYTAPYDYYDGDGSYQGYTYWDPDTQQYYYNDGSYVAGDGTYYYYPSNPGVSFQWHHFQHQH